MITFTEEEKVELAKAITKAACGIAECWDILSLIGDRIVAEYFADDENWKDPGRHTKTG